MRIAIVGCGAIGLLWAARLLRINEDVHLFVRSRERLQRLERHGFQFQDLEGAIHTFHAPVHLLDEENADSAFDLVFVTVKQVDLPNVVPHLEKMTHEKSRLLFWQNGLGHERWILQLKDRPMTCAAVTTEGAMRESRDHVIHTGRGEVWLGAFPKPMPGDEELLKKIEEWKTKLNIPIHYEEQIAVRLWEKLAVNCVINPLTALLECPNGELLQPVYDSLIYQLIEEMVPVARGKGIELDSFRLIERVRQVSRRTSGNFSSMLQDLQNGRKTEIDAINGILVQYGREMGMELKTHLLLWNLIKAKEAWIQRKKSNDGQSSAGS